MNTSEFKSWFEGYSEAIGKEEPPTPAQWKRIQEEVSKLTAETKLIPTTTRGPVPSILPRTPWPDSPTWTPGTSDYPYKFGDIVCQSNSVKS